MPIDSILMFPASEYGAGYGSDGGAQSASVPLLNANDSTWFDTLPLQSA